MEAAAGSMISHAELASLAVQRLSMLPSSMPPVKFHAGEDVLGSATEPGMMAIVSSERQSSCQVLASSAWAVYLTWLLVVVFALPPFCAIV